MQMHTIALAFGLFLDVSSRIMAHELVPLPAAEASQQQPSRNFSQQQLEELAAPIALYPDPLLSQVLMAATYPLEVVQAARFVQQNPGLTGSALETALQDRDWDPSVKSMCGFPDLLARMNDQLDWLRDLGDAFLGQQQELMDAVQRLRHTAKDAGTLQNSPQMTVQETADRAIVIEPAGDTIYVPEYYPTMVYGGWGYPNWYYPRVFVGPPHPGPAFWFGTGVVWGSALWGGFAWGPHAHVIVDGPRHDRFIERTFHDPRPRLIGENRGPVVWNHDPVHRHNVNYRDRAASERFRPTARPEAVPRTRTVPQAEPRARTVPQATQRTRTFSGARNPAFDNRARVRGQQSMQHHTTPVRPQTALRPAQQPAQQPHNQTGRPGGRERGDHP
jgi:hypothetical protein